MILYTPMQLELVTEGLDNGFVQHSALEQAVDYQGISLIARTDNNGNMTIVRLLSTNPHHYLNNKFHPGQTIKMSDSLL